MSKIKEREDCNHSNTLKYFEDYNLSVAQRLGIMAIYGWALIKKYATDSGDIEGVKK